MDRAKQRKLRVAAVGVAAACGAVSTAAGGYPLVAAAIVVLAATCLVAILLRGRRSSLAPAAIGPAAEQPPAPADEAMRTSFVTVLQEKVDLAQQRELPLTLAVVTPRVPLDTNPSARAAAVDHIRASIDRITRATDHWGPLGDGRFAVILENCGEDNAVAYGERLAVAIDNRPLIADGRRLEVVAVTVPSPFDANQFYGAADFLAAAEQRAIKEPVSAHRLVADTRLLRQRFYGKDYGVRAA